MTHGDDIGFRTPPRLAPIEAVITPIWKTDEERASVFEAADRIAADVRSNSKGREPLRLKVDKREGMKPGAKYYDWEMRGVPLRIELGPRDLAAQQVVLARRDTKEKKIVGQGVIADEARQLLDHIQSSMLATAIGYREANSVRGVRSYDVFRQLMEGEGGFVYAGWCADAACEQRIKDDTKATIRVLPGEEFRSEHPPEKCLSCGRPAAHEAMWARAY
jgi:prolyl-tRNA synthetase